MAWTLVNSVNMRSGLPIFASSCLNAESVAPNMGAKQKIGGFKFCQTLVILERLYRIS